MALRIKSGKKRHRQSLKRRARNTHIKSGLKTEIKNFMSALEAKDLAKSQELLKKTESALDKAVTKGVMHKKTASRMVSRYSKKVHLLSQTS